MPTLKDFIKYNRRKPLRRKRRQRRMRYPFKEEVRHRFWLESRLNRAKELVDQRIVPLLDGIIAESKVHRAVDDAERNDAYIERFVGSMNQVKLILGEEFSEDSDRARALSIGRDVSSFQREQLSNTIRQSVGIDVFFSEPYLIPVLEAYSVENANLIQSIATQYLGRVQSTVFENVRAGVRSAEMIDNLSEDYSISKNRARFIARDQTSKLVGQLNEMRQTELGITEYIWRTVGDERVRPTHSAKNGRTYSWSEPPSGTGHPGHDYRCRCSAEPVIEI